MMRLRKEVGRKASAFKNTAMSEGGRKEVGRKRRKDWMLSVSEGPRYSYDSARNYQWPRESITILEHSLEASGGVTWRTSKKAAVSEGSRKAVGRKCRKELEISTIS